MRRVAFLILSIGLSLAVLLFVLRDLPLGEIAGVLQAADIFWSILGILMVLPVIFTRGIRWRILLGKRISLRESFLIMSVTFLLNQLPFRLGEVARGLLVTRRKIPLLTSATSIVLERIIDLLVIVLLIAGAASQIPAIDPQIRSGALIFGAMGFGAFLVLLLLAHFPQIVHRVPWIERFVPHFLDALLPLKDWRILGETLLWTLLAWMSSYLTLYCSVRAIGLPDTPSFIFLALGLSTLSIAIPTTVAGIGFIEGAIQVAGDIFGYETIRTTALGFLYHGLTVLAYLLTGFPAAWFLGFSFGDVFKRRDS